MAQILEGGYISSPAKKNVLQLFIKITGPLGSYTGQNHGAAIQVT